MILAQSAAHGATALSPPMPTTAPSGGGDPWFWIILLAASMPGVVLCLMGAWRPGRVIGPDRASPFPSLLQWMAVLLFGFFSYMLIISAYNTRVHPSQSGPTVRTEADDAFLTTIPPLIGFALIVAGDAMLGGRRGVKEIGIDPAQIPSGIIFGILGALIAVPLVLWVSVLTDVVYQHLHYAHPMEHELLPAMTEGPRWARIAIFFGAAVAAPLFEEIIFRGHLQTLLRSAIIRVSARSNESPDFDELSRVAAPPRDPPVRPWHSWLAIALASAAFAYVHPLWMRPPIFVLSLCLGYAYERTGLLWTTITMHALFNITETILYFQQLH